MTISTTTKLHQVFSVIFTIIFITLGWKVQGDPGVVRIPFQMIDKLIVIQATADGQTGAFILDTGTPYLILNRKHFPNTRGWIINRDAAGIIGQAVPQVEITRVQFRLEEWTQNLDVELIDLQHLEDNKGINILGLIGKNAFRNSELIISYQDHELIVYALDRTGERIVSSIHPKPIECLIPFHYRGHLVCIEAHLNGHTFMLALDTGAEVNILERSQRATFEDQCADPEGGLLIGLGSRPRAVSVIRLGHLQVGSYICERMRTLVLSLKELNHRMPGGKIHGLLGYEFLRQFRTSINFKKQEIALWRVEPVAISSNRVQSLSTDSSQRNR